MKNIPINYQLLQVALLAFLISSFFTQQVKAQCNLEDIDIQYNQNEDCLFPNTVNFTSILEEKSSNIELRKLTTDYFQEVIINFPTVEGCLYTLEVEGIMTVWDDGPGSPTFNDWFDGFGKFDLVTGFISGPEGGVFSNIEPKPSQIIPNNYNENHIYEYKYLGTGEDIKYHFDDTQYSDNGGEIAFTFTAIPCYEYQWEFSNGETSDEANPDITFNEPGLYSASLTVVDLINNCSLSYQTDILIGEEYISNDQVNICEGDSYTLPNGVIVTESGEYNSFFTTQFGCDSIIVTKVEVSDTIITNPVAYFCEGDSFTLPSGEVVTEPGEYNSFFTNQLGCDSIIVSKVELVSDTIITNPVAYFCEGDSFTLPSGEVVTEPGEYNSFFTNQLGCDSIIVSKVEIGENCEPCLSIIVSGFSPNNDDINDSFFYQINCELIDFQHVVYDRWGNQVFRTEEKGIFWDGTYNNNSPIGTYVWVIKYTTVDGDNILEKGNITLVK